MLYFGVQSYDIKRFLDKNEKLILEAEVMASIRNSFFTMKGFLYLTSNRIIFRPKNNEYFPWMAIIRIGWIHSINLKDISTIKIEIIKSSNRELYNLKIDQKNKGDSFLFYTMGDQKLNREEVDKWKKLIEKSFNKFKD
jgi:hypothetical protein